MQNVSYEFTPPCIIIILNVSDSVGSHAWIICTGSMNLWYKTVTRQTALMKKKIVLYKIHRHKEKAYLSYVAAKVKSLEVHVCSLLYVSGTAKPENDLQPGLTKTYKGVVNCSKGWWHYKCLKTST